MIVSVAVSRRLVPLKVSEKARGGDFANRLAPKPAFCGSRMLIDF